MSLINDALKRAAEAQSQAQGQTPSAPGTGRPRGPKGVEDLPVPMTPVATAERPTWVPVAGIAVIILVLLGASGYFFMQWWKQRQAWQPYATENIDEHGNPITNSPVAKVETPKAVTPKVTPPPVSSTNVPPPVPVATNPPVSTNVPVPPPVPLKTNLPAAVITNPAPAVVVTNPVVPPPVVVVVASNPPPPVPVPTPITNAPPPVVVPPSPPTTNPPVVVAVKPEPPKDPAADFPEMKLQGIIRGKKKTSATVNGKTLFIGDRIEGAFLLKIDQESVTFEKGGVKKELFLLR